LDILSNLVIKLQRVYDGCLGIQKR
jgi:hypothetical protein